jgi:threonine/homoserine/homoserine lactone efflux protein
MAHEQDANFTLPSPSRTRQAFSKAVVTGVFNPKVALFFLAFLPQFVDPQCGAVFVRS